MVDTRALLDIDASVADAGGEDGGRGDCGDGANQVDQSPLVEKLSALLGGLLRRGVDDLLVQRDEGGESEGEDEAGDDRGDREESASVAHREHGSGRSTCHRDEDVSDLHVTQERVRDLEVAEALGRRKVLLNLSLRGGQVQTHARKGNGGSHRAEGIRQGVREEGGVGEEGSSRDDSHVVCVEVQLRMANRSSSAPLP